MFGFWGLVCAVLDWSPRRSIVALCLESLRRELECREEFGSHTTLSARLYPLGIHIHGLVSYPQHPQMPTHIHTSPLYRTVYRCSYDEISAD